MTRTSEPASPFVADGAQPNEDDKEGGSTVRPGNSQKVRSRPRRALLIGPVVIILVLLVLFIGSPLLPFGFPIGYHRTCSLGGPAVSVSTFTPVAAVDTPYLGDASLNWTWNSLLFTSGSLTEASTVQWNPGHLGQRLGSYWTAGNGSVQVLAFENISWQVYLASNSTAWGGGPGEPCTSPFVARGSILPSLSIEDAGTKWQGPGNLTDQAVPYTYPSAPSFGGGQSALIDLRFHTANSPDINTCNDAGISRSSPYMVPVSVSAEVPFGLPFTIGGTPHVIWGTMEWGSTASWGPTLTYMFATQGVWQVDSSIPGGPGFYAFNYHSCP